jgi:hypothetical protein
LKPDAQAQEATVAGRDGRRAADGHGFGAGIVVGDRRGACGERRPGVEIAGAFEGELHVEQMPAAAILNVQGVLTDGSGEQRGGGLKGRQAEGVALPEAVAQLRAGRVAVKISTPGLARDTLEPFQELVPGVRPGFKNSGQNSRPFNQFF